MNLRTAFFCRAGFAGGKTSLGFPPALVAIQNMKLGKIRISSAWPASVFFHGAGFIFCAIPFWFIVTFALTLPPPPCDDVVGCAFSDFSQPLKSLFVVGHWLGFFSFLRVVDFHKTLNQPNGEQTAAAPSSKRGRKARVKQ